VSARLGVLGGSFDPPHVGHLWLATLAADAMALDRVLVVPAPRPPHKPGWQLSPAENRLAMASLAVADDPRLEVSTIELEREGPSYTVDTLEALRSASPDAELVLVMAADSLAGISTWRRPERLLQLAEWAVGPRPGSAPPPAEELARQLGGDARRIHLLDGPALDVSATEIRARVAAGRAIRYLVPRGVERYIAEHALYRGRAT
jgi:nicotinate-nucleotide adenylyltransferase